MEEVEFVRLVFDIMDINCTDADGHTPLMLLCKHRNADSILKDVQTLLEKRKDVKVQGTRDIFRGRVDDLDEKTQRDILYELCPQ